MDRMKRFVAVVLSVVLVVSLCACGGKKGSKVKDYVGYYTYTTRNNVDHLIAYAMEINKNGDVVWRLSREKYADFRVHGKTTGTINIEGNKACFYNMNYEGDSELNWDDIFPLTLTLINDGNGLYLESASEDWSPDSYTRIDKKEFESFCIENQLYLDDEEESKK